MRITKAKRNFASTDIYNQYANSLIKAGAELEEEASSFLEDLAEYVDFLKSFDAENASLEEIQDAMDNLHNFFASCGDFAAIAQRPSAITSKVYQDMNQTNVALYVAALRKTK